MMNSTSCALRRALTGPAHAPILKQAKYRMRYSTRLVRKRLTRSPRLTPSETSRLAAWLTARSTSW